MAYAQKLCFRIRASSRSFTTRQCFYHQFSCQISRPIRSPRCLEALGPKKYIFQANSFQKCSLSTETIDQDFVDNAKNRKVVNLSTKKLPLSVRSLLERRSKESTFPRLHRLSKLSREFSFAGVDVDQAEKLLRKQILSAKSRKTLDQPYHESKTILEQFLASPTRSDARKAALKSFFESYEQLEKSESANVENLRNKNLSFKSDQSETCLNRISYFVQMVRLGFVVESAARHFDAVSSIKYILSWQTVMMFFKQTFLV